MGLDVLCDFFYINLLFKKLYIKHIFKKSQEIHKPIDIVKIECYI